MAPPCRSSLQNSAYIILLVVLTTDLTDWLKFNRGAIVHMVMFRYQPTLSQSTKNDVASAFLALKDSCRLPDGSRYIVSLDGGSFTSPEGRGKGLEVSPYYLFNGLLLSLSSAYSQSFDTDYTTFTNFYSTHL